MLFLHVQYLDLSITCCLIINFLTFTIYLYTCSLILLVGLLVLTHTNATRIHTVSPHQLVFADRHAEVSYARGAIGIEQAT